MKYSLLISLAIAGSLIAAEPSAKPFLRIEAGMHTATIRHIATDAAGRVALTCSDDKTAKLWSLEPGKEGTLLRTFRCPIGGVMRDCFPPARSAQMESWRRWVGGRDTSWTGNSVSMSSIPPPARWCGAFLDYRT